MTFTPSAILAYANKLPPAQRAMVMAQLAPNAAPDAPTATKARRGMNKTEAAFARHLEALRLSGAVLWFEFESMRLHLGGGAYFRPDFPTLMADGSLRFFETKGFVREAAKVRLRVAAGKFPHWKFVIVRKVGAEFSYEEIQP